MQQTNNLLIAALESARDGIIITDLQGVVLHVNSALERMFGFNRQELIGQNAATLFRSDHRPANGYSMKCGKRCTTAAAGKGELVNKRKDGTLVDTR